ncbi:SPOR domain-containing protein [Siphonobacter sp. SORGH_AS_0500]|uniref:HU domain-containing protein n=1 Tax=Siphonobacter sp. SORGH_AS_0500 TaxID=1864824 RepID=UPI0028549A8A|nr:SPOR domain-containing protein [Siphonobacter sp. SORGH_AS_0500]MDR6195244.1 hypothetical protein [Siphonobacter sp. SORGH_AS_0500]
MATIPEHVRNLLFEQDCVVIPEFGGFIGNFDSATFLSDGSVLPPRTRLVFNEMLQFDDGLLSNHVSKSENISREETRNRLKQFVEQVKLDIRSQQQYRFEHLGTFTQNGEGKLVFAPQEKVNYYGEGYGLASFVPAYHRHYAVNQATETASVVETLAEEPMESNLTVAHSSKRLGRWVAAAVLVVVTVVGAWYTGQKTNLSSMNPMTALDFSWLNSKKVSQPVSVVNDPIHAKVAITPKPAPKVEVVDIRETPKVEVEAAEEKVVKNKVKFLVTPSRVKTIEGEAVPSGYYVVAGSFGSVKSAQVMKKQLLSKGYKVELLRPRKGLVKVTVSDRLNTASAAQAMAQKLGPDFNNNLWILKSIAD